MMRRGSRRLIRASEIGQYAFCARAWWLSQVQKQASSHAQEMAAGDQAHAIHGGWVHDAEQLRWMAGAFFVLALIVAGILLIRLLTG